MTRFRDRPTLKAQKLRTNATDAEKKLWTHLSRRQLNGFKFSRQMPVGPYICDFMCREAKLVVELDGGQHDELAGYDAARTEFIEASGYRLVRFWNTDVLSNTDYVLTAIGEAPEGPPPPTPPARGRGARP